MDAGKIISDFVFLVVLNLQFAFHLFKLIIDLFVLLDHFLQSDTQLGVFFLHFYLQICEPLIYLFEDRQVALGLVDDFFQIADLHDQLFVALDDLHQLFFLLVETLQCGRDHLGQDLPALGLEVLLVDFEILFSAFHYLDCVHLSSASALLQNVLRILPRHVLLHLLLHFEGHLSLQLKQELWRKGACLWQLGLCCQLQRLCFFRLKSPCDRIL